MSEGFPYNTSYDREYVVLSASKDGVVLRPVDANFSIPTYWKEFISGYVDVPVPEDVVITLYLTQLPAEVQSVDAYVDYSVEFPRVEVHINDIVVDVSDRVACNHPNPETPGLYALDFTLSVGGDVSTPIWRSYVSIEEPPILRHIITPWNREDRVIADLNRLVLEPQFQEALYEEGMPLYNFQQANAPAAVSSFNATNYRDARAFVKEGRIFITGPHLPVGTEVSVKGVARTLGIKVLTTPFTIYGDYAKGEVVSYGGYDYYALMDIPKRDTLDGEEHRMGSIIPGSPYEVDGSAVTCWLRGVYYVVDDIGMPDGEYDLDYLWSILDVGGYLFKMDLLRAFPVKHYWGHYNRKYFYDYAPGDLVSVITDNVFYLYQRNETTIAEKGLEDTYRPGHYKNPHWTEVYSESNDTMLRDPIIRPYTNSTNAIVSKTYPVREEAFRIYAKMVGMPTELVDALGTKYSVLLWALLYRTRETFPGFRAALRAIGLDASDLHRVYPSVKYTFYKDGESEELGNVYDEIAAVKLIAQSVKADKIWYGDGVPDIHNDKDMRNVEQEIAAIPWIRYSREGEQPDMVWKLSDSGDAWEPYYSFEHIGTDRDSLNYDFSVNNRYYRATVNMLDRLAADCVVDVGDGKQWIDQNHIGSISEALVALLDYEIPIYIYFRLKMRLVAIGHIGLKGIMGPAVLHEEWGGQVGLKLFPGKYFDYTTTDVRWVYPKVLYSYEKMDPSSADSEWTEYPNFGRGNGFRFYAFDRPVYLRFRFEKGIDGIVFKEAEGGKWISQFTIGCLGDAESTSTDDDFTDATEMPSGSDLFLCKGMSAMTMRIAPSTLKASALVKVWKYVLDEGETWVMDETTPFADFEEMEDIKFFGYWGGNVPSFADAVDRVTASGEELPFQWNDAVLKIGKKLDRNVYLWNSDGSIIGMLQLGSMDRVVLDDPVTSSDGDNSNKWVQVDDNTYYATLLKVTFLDE